jgi:hypothetical protein
MGWSITINDLAKFEGFTEEQEKFFEEQHPMYGQDSALALELAKQSELASCTLSGGRTPDPYRPDNEHIIITVIGFNRVTDFVGGMKDIINNGPDAVPSDLDTAKKFHEHLDQDWGEDI